ncbi:conjugal transfer protein TrbL family protein [Paenibacillus validus]|uniref:conjugal transfer protein TrbL family protein n=1 Tax=Paenibacillus validus TaxID=44253 RepID=UPI003D2B27F4
MSWLIEKAIEDFFKKLVEQAINLFLSFLAAINGMASQVLDMPVVTQGILYSQALAGTILITKVAYEAWVTHILRQNGDPDADPGGLLFRSASAAAFIGGVPWLVKWMYQFGTTVAGDIARLPGVDYSSAGSPFEALLDMVVAQSTYPLFMAVGVLFALVIFIVILIQTFIRAAELAVVAVVGSFMALGLTNPNSSSFSSWFKELMSISMAQAVQMYLVKVSFFTLTYFSFAGMPLFNLFLFCGFLWVTYKSPSILKQYVYSTGVGKAAGGTASSVGSMVMMRKIFTKGA